MAPCFIEPELLPIVVLHCTCRDIPLLLLLWPWPWPDDLHIRTWPVTLQDVLESGREKINFLSRLSKVIVRQTDRQTDRRIAPVEGVIIEAQLSICITVFLHRVIYFKKLETLKLRYCVFIYYRIAHSLQMREKWKKSEFKQQLLKRTLPSNILRPTTRKCVHLVTRGHFRSRDMIAVALIDPRWPKTPCYTQTSWRSVV